MEINYLKFIGIIGFGEEIEYKLNTLKIISYTMITRLIEWKKCPIYVGKYKRPIINPKPGCVWSPWYIIKLYDRYRAISIATYYGSKEEGKLLYLFKNLTRLF